MNAYGTRVYCTTAEQYERLLCCPGSLTGTFDHTAKQGHVDFATVAAALAARVEAE